MPVRVAGGARTRGVERQTSPGCPLVSIITIVRNGKAILRPTIESVLRQDYANVEYIIIDGGSTDGTVSVLYEYDEQVDYWQSEPDKGISDAFNKGIGLAHGELIGLINAGDWYENDALSRIVAAFLAEPDTGVVCGRLQFWKGESKEYVCQSVPRLLKCEMTVTHPTCFVRAECYDRYGLFSIEYDLAMDYELLLRFKCQGVKFVALDMVLANMQHDGISEADWKKALRETHRARVEQMGGSVYATKKYLYWLMLKRQIRIILEWMGCDRFLQWYRGRLALVKKNRPLP